VAGIIASTLAGRSGDFVARRCSRTGRSSAPRRRFAVNPRRNHITPLPTARVRAAIGAWFAALFERGGHLIALAHHGSGASLDAAGERQSHRSRGERIGQNS
jgi:hypothetical protein